MKCESRPLDIIFKVVRLTREGENQAYIFVGQISDRIRNVLTRIEKGGKPSDSDKKALSEHFGKDYNSKLGLTTLFGSESNRKWNKVTYIDELINGDDTIFMIRKKIFVHLSVPSRNKYLIENNQELWVELDDKHHGKSNKSNKSNDTDKYKILGYYYDGVSIVPSVYSKISADLDFVTKDGERRIQKDRIKNDNSMILSDMLDIPAIQDMTIYLSYLDDEKEYVKLKFKKDVDKVLLNGYFVKHWPYGTLNVDADELKDKFKGIKNRLDTDDYIIDLIKDTPIPKNFCTQYFIRSMRISVNNHLKHESKYINLLKIYKDLRLSQQLPFMSYKGDEEDDVPPYQIYKPIVHRVSQSRLLSWIKKVKKRGGRIVVTDDDEFKRVKGLTLKFLQFTEDDEPLYSTIHIYASGHYEMELNYTEKFRASIENIKEYLDRVSKLVDSINQIDYIIGRHGSKLEKPGLIIDGGMVYRQPNTIISNLNAFANIELGMDYNYATLGDFAKCFTPYVGLVRMSKKDRRAMNELRLRYKRVSNYYEVDEIYEKISALREAGEDEFSIIRMLGQHYQLTTEEATRLMDKWNRNFSKISTGIVIIVKGNKIELSNIKELNVLPTLNHFVIALITLFENRDKLKKTDKDFRKYILDYCGRSRNEGNYNNSNNDLVEDLAQIETGNYANSTEIVQNLGNVANVEDLLDNFSTSYDDLTAEYSNADILAYEKDKKEGSPSTSTNDTNQAERTLKNAVLEDNEAKRAKHVVHTVRDDINSKSGEQPYDDYDSTVKIGSDCPEVDYRTDVCKDPCHDLSYRLRRLQKHDARLWRSDTSKEKSIKHSTVSRSSCQKKNQPIVMRNNPETNPNVDRSAFTYAVRYGSDETHQNYYICPKVWCPRCEKPIPYEKVKGTIIDRKGVKCKTAKCPYCKGEAMVSPAMNAIYPGFSSKARIDDLCIPCCMKMTYMSGSKKRVYDLCMKKDRGENDEGDTMTNLYILGREKPKQDGAQQYVGNITPTNRYSILPITVSKILKTKTEPGYTNPGDRYYIRKGITPNNIQSFLQAMADVISENSSLKSKKDNKIVTVSELKQLMSKALDQKMYDSLRNGIIKIMFHNPNNPELKSIDNYKKFLKSEEQIITEEYVWDLLQRPGVITPEGLNIIILTPTKIKCPSGMNASDFYRTNRPTCVIINVGHFYEPVYLVKNRENNITETSIFNAENPDIAKLLEQIVSRCKTRDNQVAYDNELLNYKLYNIPYIKYTPEMTLTRTLSELHKLAEQKKNKQYLVKTQLVDNYNKVIGVILNNGGMVPVQPAGLRTNLSFTYDMPNMRYRDQLKILDDVSRGSKIPCQPIRKVASYDGHSVLGILTETGRIVPVKKENLPNDKMGVADLYYYPDADKQIATGEQLDDERLTTLRKYNYEDESYQRFRFEISKYVVRHEKEMNELSLLIRGKEDESKSSKSKTDTKMDTKTNNEKNGKEGKSRAGKKQRVEHVRKFLTKLADKLVKVEPESKLNLKGYEVPNRREACFFKNEMKVKDSERQQLCRKDPHCILVGKICKLRINKNNLVTKKENLPRYLTMMADELVNNKSKREEILEDKIDDIIDTSRFELTDDTMLVSRMNILKQIDNLYHESQDIYISTAPLFDKTQPALTPAEIAGATKASAHSENTNDSASRSDRLGDFWNKYFDSRYRYIRTPDSQATIFNVMFKALNSIDRDLTMKKMRESLIYFIDELDVSTVKRFFFSKAGSDVMDTSLGWKLLLEAYKTIDPRTFRAVDEFRQLSQLLESPSYGGNLIDLKLLAVLYKVRVIMLNKKAGEEDEDDATIVAEDLVTRDQYVLLLANIKKTISHFYLVDGKGQKVFAKNDLPPSFREFIFDEDLGKMIPSESKGKKKR